MKTIPAVFVAIILAVSTNSFAQHPKPPSGKWYGYTDPKKMIEYNFGPKSITFSRFFYNGTPDSMLPNTKTTKLIKTVYKHGNFYEILLRDTLEDQLNVIVVNIIHPTKNKGEMIVAINPGERRFGELDSAMAFIESDTEPKYGWSLFSEERVKEFKKMKPIERITIPHLAAYLDSVIKIKPAFDSLKNEPRILGLTAYSQFKIRDFVRQMGYNPLHESSRLDELIRLNGDNPEIKPRIIAVKTVRRGGTVGTR
ncbi:MAG TPA: hypothetical protein VFO76_00990 [Candidatus Kapabacteria bacterium]|nr:hypothetical protein [Candidatus Kapabacteria bacterium]